MMMDADDDDETMPNEGDSEGYWGRNHNKYDTEKRKKKKRKKKKRTIWNDGNEESKMPNQKKQQQKNTAALLGENQLISTVKLRPRSSCVLRLQERLVLLGNGREELWILRAQ